MRSLRALACFSLLMVPAFALAQDAVPVTPDNFVRAETHMYFNNRVREDGLAEFHHIRELMPIAH